MPSISYPLALLAGLLSSLSPCVLPLMPAYLGYLSGTSLSGPTFSSRRKTFSNAICFVAGLGVVFVVVFGLPTTLLSGALQEYSGWIAKVGGIVLILFGLHTTEILRFRFLYTSRTATFGEKLEPGYVRSALMGGAFAVSWTPCIGPLLGTVMTLAFSEPTRALGLLGLYALGMAVPFLLIAAFLGRAQTWAKPAAKYTRAVQVVSGLLMVTVGVLLVTGVFGMLNVFLIRMTPQWLLRFL